MDNFESFKPQLKAGSIHPIGNRVIFETKNKFAQVILPIELADLLVLCDGKKTMREIVEDLYKKNHTVHFKNIFGAILHLKKNEVLENGHDLDDQSSHLDPYSSRSFFSLRAFFEVPFGQRIINDRPYPTFFYLLAMSLILGAIYVSEGLFSEELSRQNLLVNESFFQTLIGLIFFTSLMISIKNLVKCLLLLFLTGRVYNFKLVFSGLALYLRVGTESLGLVANRLFLTLFHSSLVLSYVIIPTAFAIINPHSEYQPMINGLAMLLILLELNPFQDSELSEYFKALFNDEGIIRLKTFFKNHSLLALLSPYEKTRIKSTYLTFSYFSILWSAVVAWILYKINSLFIVAAWTTISMLPSWVEKISATIFLSTLITLSFLALVNLSNTALITLLRPLIRLIKILGRKRNAQKISEYNDKNLLKALARLPLFGYFNDELLKLVISRSELVFYPVKTNVIVEGDMGKNIFVLLNGVMKVTKRDDEGSNLDLTEIHAPSIFGEVAAIEDCPRTAGVVAKADSIVLRVPAEVARNAAKQSEYIREIHGFRNAIMVSQFFTSAPLFRELPDEAVHLFTTKGKLENFTAGQRIFSQGNFGDSFYLLIRGTVGVNINGNKVNQIHQGGFFGEIAVIADVPRTASIYAIEPTMVLKIHADAFWEILAQNIEMALFIEAVGEMRMKEDLQLLDGSSIPLRK